MYLKKKKKEIQQYFERDVKPSMSQSSSDTDQFYLEDSSQYVTICTNTANSTSTHLKVKCQQWKLYENSELLQFSVW